MITRDTVVETFSPLRNIVKGVTVIEMAMGVLFPL
jgi:hypothetical protein